MNEQNLTKLIGKKVSLADIFCNQKFTDEKQFLPAYIRSCLTEKNLNLYQEAMDEYQRANYEKTLAHLSVLLKDPKSLAATDIKVSDVLKLMAGCLEKLGNHELAGQFRERAKQSKKRNN